MVSTETLIVSKRQYKEILSTEAVYEDKQEDETNYNKEIYLIAGGYKKLKNEIKKIGKKSSFYEEIILPNYQNINMILYDTHMLILGIKFILYGVIGLIALTTITNIINTVNINREMKKRKFAILNWFVYQKISKDDIDRKFVFRNENLSLGSTDFFRVGSFLKKIIPSV